MLTLEELTSHFHRASRERRICRARWKGEFLSRTIHPYGVCSTMRNQIVLVCWQSMGFTKAGGKPGFRNLILGDCEELEVLEDQFRIVDGFNPKDGQYKEWVYHILDDK